MFEMFEEDKKKKPRGCLRVAILILLVIVIGFGLLVGVCGFIVVTSR